MNTNPIKSALNIQLKGKLIFGILQVRSSLILFEQIKYTDRIFFKNKYDINLSYYDVKLKLLFYLKITIVQLTENLQKRKMYSIARP